MSRKWRGFVGGSTAPRCRDAAHASASARRHSRQRLLATIGAGTSSRRRRRAVRERLGAGTIDNFRIRKAATPCVSTRRGLSGGPGAGSGRFSAGSECPSGQETARTRTRGHGRQHGAAWPFRRGLVPTCRLRRRATAAADDPAQLSLLQQLVLVLLDQLPGGLERDEMHRVSPLIAWLLRSCLPQSTPSGAGYTRCEYPRPVWSELALHVHE